MLLSSQSVIDSDAASGYQYSSSLLWWTVDEFGRAGNAVEAS